MIHPDALGEFKDGAASLVALSDLLASRRVAPKTVAASLGSVIDACDAVLTSSATLTQDVLEATADYPEAAAEIRAAYDQTAAAVKTLENEAFAALAAPVDARVRLVLERAAYEACGRLATALLIGDLFILATKPRPVSVRVADVLSFGPTPAEGPQVIRATLQVPLEPITTSDPRLLRALVELGLQIVAKAGVEHPHIDAEVRSPTGACVRMHEAPGAVNASPPFGSNPVLLVRRVLFLGPVSNLWGAAAKMGGILTDLNAEQTAVTLELP
ncbi:MAG: hypothetical protein IPK82_05730 [Polyangiaceae bacterium]|nr:hypothetical protein [Polyangiaceae bacterium]